MSLHHAVKSSISRICTHRATPVRKNQMLPILNWKTRQFDSRRSGIHSLEDCQHSCCTAVHSGRTKISPNFNDIARNYLATHKWPLSAIKMLFALRGCHWLYIKSPQVLESDSNKTIASLAKTIILDGLESFWDDDLGAGIEDWGDGVIPFEVFRNQTSLF